MGQAAQPTPTMSPHGLTSQFNSEQLAWALPTCEAPQMRQNATAPPLLGYAWLQGSHTSQVPRDNWDESERGADEVSPMKPPQQPVPTLMHPNTEETLILLSPSASVQVEWVHHHQPWDVDIPHNKPTCIFITYCDFERGRGRNPGMPSQTGRPPYDLTPHPAGGLGEVETHTTLSKHRLLRSNDSHKRLCFNFLPSNVTY